MQYMIADTYFSLCDMYISKRQVISYGGGQTSKCCMQGTGSGKLAVSCGFWSYSGSRNQAFSFAKSCRCAEVSLCKQECTQISMIVFATKGSGLLIFAVVTCTREL